MEVVNISDLQDGELVSLAEARTKSLARNAQARAAAELGGAATVAGGAGYAIAKSGLWMPMGLFLGKWVVGPYAAWKSLPLIDWFANKLDKWADKLPGKDFPVIGQTVGALCAGMDWVKMKIAPEKSLAEYIKKDKEERRKLAEKELKGLREGEKKMEKKHDAEAKKKKRKGKLEKKFGEEGANLLLDEMDDLEKEEATGVPIAA